MITINEFSNKYNIGYKESKYIVDLLIGYSFFNSDNLEDPFDIENNFTNWLYIEDKNEANSWIKAIIRESSNEYIADLRTEMLNSFKDKDLSTYYNWLLDELYYNYNPTINGVKSKYNDFLDNLNIKTKHNETPFEYRERILEELKHYFLKFSIDKQKEIGYY